MRSVYKYQLQVKTKQSVYLPKGAQILSVQPQRDQVCIWALVDTNADPFPLDIHIYGTGHEMPEGANFRHLDTFQLENGALIFHVFQRLHDQPTSTTELK